MRSINCFESFHRHSFNGIALFPFTRLSVLLACSLASFNPFTVQLLQQHTVLLCLISFCNSCCWCAISTIFLLLFLTPIAIYYLCIMGFFHLLYFKWCVKIKGNFEGFTWWYSGISIFAADEIYNRFQRLGFQHTFIRANDCVEPFIFSSSCHLSSTNGNSPIDYHPIVRAELCANANFMDLFPNEIASNKWMNERTHWLKNERPDGRIRFKNICVSVCPVA